MDEYNKSHILVEVHLTTGDKVVGFVDKSESDQSLSVTRDLFKTDIMNAVNTGLKSIILETGVDSDWTIIPGEHVVMVKVLDG
jgi:ribonucleotide monophosphatase NagD (HAD superfamily)